MDRNMTVEELLGEAGWLRRLAASLVGDGALAEDLVQDTWVRALRRPPSDTGAPRPWLARVVRNLARNARRERGRRAAREALAHPEPAKAGPAELAQEAEAQRMLAEAVTRLPEPLRAVVVLRYFRGLDSGAVGAQLGLPASTVRTRLQRALEELRGQLDRRVKGGRESWAALLAPLARSPAPGALGPSGSAAASAAPSALWQSLLVASAAAAGVLAVVGTSWWTFTRGEEQVTSVPPAPAVAAGGTAQPQEDHSSPGDARGAAETGERRVPIAGTEPVAAGAAGQGAAELSGTVLVDGAPPQWPLALLLVPWSPAGPAGPAQPAQELKVKARGKVERLVLAPEQRGAFAFRGLAPDWSGRLVVEDDAFAFADGSSSLRIDAQASGVVVELVSGPEIVGRIVGPDGRPVPDLEGDAHLRIGTDEVLFGEISRGFLCRSDGRFRIPSEPSDDSGRLTIVVEAEDQGFLHHVTEEFVLARGHDAGELVLEPLRSIRFKVRDPEGTPIEGAFAAVDVPSRRKLRPLTGPDGSGVLALAPDRAVEVRFRAFGHADRVAHVEPGDSPEIVLERLAVLEVRLLGSLPEGAGRVLVAGDHPAFVWDESYWGDDAHFQLMLGGCESRGWRTPNASRTRYEYEFHPVRYGHVELAGLTPDVALTVEALDKDGNTLASATVSVGREQRTVLELGEPGPDGGAPAPEQRRGLRGATKREN